MGIKILEAGKAEPPVKRVLQFEAGGVSETIVVPAPAPAPTPTETIVRAASTGGTFVGPSGRSYAFKRLTPLDRMLIAKALGGELMTNSVYASYAFVAASVTQLNGEDQPIPSSSRQIEARVQRIGTDWDLLNLTMAVTFAPPKGDEDQDGDED